MKDTNPNQDMRGNLPTHKLALDPEKLGMMNRINWQKYVKPENTAFIMVDHQKDFMAPDGNAYEIGCNPMWVALGALENTLKIVKVARKHRMKIYWLRGGFFGIGKDIPLYSPQGEWFTMLQAEFPGVVTRDGRDYGIIDELQAVMEPQDIVMDKSASSSFIGTDLHRYLVLGGVKNIIICGCMTDTCVEGTARSGFDLGYYALVVADASVCNTWEDQYHTLYHLSNLIATIIMTDEIIAVLERNSSK